MDINFKALVCAFCVLNGALLSAAHASGWESFPSVVLQPGANTNAFIDQAYGNFLAAEGLKCGLTGPNSDSCPGFTSCGGDGRAGICGCTPRSSYPAAACGVHRDDCGSYVDFGGCSAGQICGGNGTCQTLATAENVTCGATLQSNKHYKFSGGSSGGTCFSISAGSSNIVIDGDGKTLTAATAFFVNNGAQNIVIKNFVLDASAGIQFGTNVFPDPTTCSALVRDIRVQGNTFIQGGLDMGASTAYACNLRIDGNRINQGAISLGHISFRSGVGGHVITDNVLERRSTTNSGLTLTNLDQVLLLNNSIRHLSTITTVKRMAVLENRFHVTGAIGGNDINGVSMLKMAGFRRSRFAGNYVHNQESTSPSIYRMAINTYNSQGSEYLWNTIIQQLPSPATNSEQMAINFRSAPNDNYIYRNNLRAYYESGYALKTLAASPSCEIDGDTGAMGSCNPTRNVIDSNLIVGSSKALYLGDSADFTVRNNVLVGGGYAVYNCGSPAHDFVHNLLDGGASGFEGGSCPGSVNNIVYEPAVNGTWFKNRPAYDYHLLAGAGAINVAGVNSLALNDLAGIARPFGGNADAGPYEFINDTQDPSVPTGISATPMSWSRIRLNWNPSTDNDAIAHYNVYVFSAGSFVLLTSVPTTRAFGIGLSSNTLYRYKVSAVDRSGRESALSAEVSATTSTGLIDLPPGDGVAPASPSGLRLN